MSEREYRAEIEALKKRIAELESAEIEADGPPHPRYKPRDKGEYSEIMSYGSVSANTWSDQSDYCAHALDIGNAFRTQEEAEFALERLRVITRMREWSGKWDDPYALAYNRLLAPGARIQAIDRRAYCPLGEMRFASNEDAEKCIEAVGGDMIERYYFMTGESCEQTGKTE